MTDLDLPADGESTGVTGTSSAVLTNPVGTLAVALVVGLVLGATARMSPVALGLAVIAVQLVVAPAWVLGTSLPGRNGALILAVLAGGGADLTVLLHPHSRLGDLVLVFGLSVPAMFVHQLMRGAARVRVVSSLAGIAILLLTVTALPALIQIRHEFGGGDEGGRIASGVVAIAAGALVVSTLVDMLMPAPRFDTDVARGLLAIVAAAGLGGSLGHLFLTTSVAFDDGRGTFAGVAIGAVVALLAVAAAFVEQSTPVPTRTVARRLRPVLSAVVPLCLIAPLGFLVCLVLRT